MFHFASYLDGMTPRWFFFNLVISFDTKRTIKRFGFRPPPFAFDLRIAPPLVRIQQPRFFARVSRNRPFVASDKPWPPGAHFPCCRQVRALVLSPPIRLVTSRQNAAVFLCKNRRSCHANPPFSLPQIHPFPSKMIPPFFIRRLNTWRIIKYPISRHASSRCTFSSSPSLDFLHAIVS